MSGGLASGCRFRFRHYDANSAGITLERDASLTGHMTIAIEPMPLDGTSNSEVRLFRSTNTTGYKQLGFYKGDNTATKVAYIEVQATGCFLGERWTAQALYNKPFVVNETRFWEDASHNLRAKHGSDPSTDADGRLVVLFRTALMRKSATQTITTAAGWGTVTWQTNVRDTDSLVDLANNQFVIPAALAGRYARLSFNIQATAGDWLTVRIVRNGAHEVGLPQVESDGWAINGISAPMLLAAGDTFKLQLDAAGVDATIASTTETWFAIELV